MKNIWPVVGILISVILNTAGAAEEEKSTKEICAPLEKLLSYVKTCHDNGLFVQVAQRCNKRIKDAIDKAQEQLSVVAKAGLLTDPSSQRNNLLETQANLLRAQQTLNHFSRISEKALKELKAYARQLQLPAGASREEVKELGLENFFAEFPCYQDNGSELIQNISAATARLEDLQKANRQVAELQAKLGVAVRGLEEGSASNKIVSGDTNPQAGSAPSQPAVKGSLKNSNSDITGIKTEQP